MYNDNGDLITECSFCAGSLYDVPREVVIIGDQLFCSDCCADEWELQQPQMEGVMT